MDIGNLVYTFFNSPGPGGVVAMTVLTLAVVIYYLLARWIIGGGENRLGDHDRLAQKHGPAQE